MHCFHRWPFLFLVRIKDACKLYCRASASSAYYLLKDKVVDGTKCGPDTFDMCVNGICQVSADDIHVVIPVFYLFSHTTFPVCYRKVDANSWWWYTLLGIWIVTVKLVYSKTSVICFPELSDIHSRLTIFCMCFALYNLTPCIFPHKISPNTVCGIRQVVL